MGFRRFLTIIAAVGVLVLVSRLILNITSIPGGLRLVMVLGLAAIVGLAIADSGPRHERAARSTAAANGPRFVVAARPTPPATDARSLPRTWREQQAWRKQAGSAPQSWRPLRPLPGPASPHPSTRPRRGRRSRENEGRPGGPHPVRRSVPDGARDNRVQEWRRPPL